jgi:hypothetical protein
MTVALLDQLFEAFRAFMRLEITVGSTETLQEQLKTMQSCALRGDLDSLVLREQADEEIATIHLKTLLLISQGCQKLHMTSNR